ncbi:MAG: DNA recombination protein RmuC [Patescibacteria group bacterium]|nr:DNA recombination protein RmuC [Patescibacteria group bacterium]
METVLVIVFLVLLLANAGLIIAVLLKRQTPPGAEGLSVLGERIAELAKTMDERLDRTSQHLTESVQKQMSESYRIIKDVTEGLTKLDETNRQVVSFADQLQNLQDILKNPKQRGILGEYYLETVLKNVMPPGSFQMQYQFRNGEIVDAVVFMRDRIIPIDSKFSLDNYNKAISAREGGERDAYEKAFKQDLKIRIDETSKYVRPEENTMEFAFMFIPSEGVYYDLLVNQVGAMKTNTRDLIEYAFSKKVIIVSPTSFLAYLQTVLQGLKALQIEEQAKDIQKRVGELGKHLNAYDEYMKKLGNTLQTSVNHYTAAYREFGKIDKDVMRISGEAANIVPLSVLGPEREE